MSVGHGRDRAEIVIRINGDNEHVLRFEAQYPSEARNAEMIVRIFGDTARAIRDNPGSRQAINDTLSELE